MVVIIHGRDKHRAQPLCKKRISMIAPLDFYLQWVTSISSLRIPERPKKGQGIIQLKAPALDVAPRKWGGDQEHQCHVTGWPGAHRPLSQVLTRTRRPQCPTATGSGRTILLISMITFTGRVLAITPHTSYFILHIWRIIHHTSYITTHLRALL